jgi:SRSO17 transposase
MSVEERDLEQWAEAFAAFHARFAPHFFRAEVRTRSAAYVQALLGPVERKNGWQLAEALGEADPNGTQRLLYQAVWDEDAVRDELQAFVTEQFGDPEGIFVVDETGFLKKGTQSVGVQRQYSGTAGKVENCQIGVFLTYVSAQGHAFLDRRLYLPEAWADDPVRRATAQVPEGVCFQTKPELALLMLEHAWRHGVPGGWVTGDEVYGQDPRLTEALEAAGRRYVLAVPATQPIWAARPAIRRGPRGGRHVAPEAPPATTVQAVVGAWPAEIWTRLSAGDGAKGPRVYDWAAQRVVASRDQRPGPDLWLLARRACTAPTEIAYYLACAPADTPLTVLVRVAGARWTVEQCLAEAKGETGLDHYEVRQWRSWYRHITLSLLAHAFLASTRRAPTTVTASGPTVGEKAGPAPEPRPRPDPADRARGASVARPHVAVAPALPSVPPRLVALASPPSSPRSPRALSASSSGPSQRRVPNDPDLRL